MNRHLNQFATASFTALLLAASFTAIAAPPSPKPTGKAWLDMDYGPYLTATVESGEPAGNFAYKGIVIRIGEKETDTVVFDTDTLRYSAGWRDGYISMSGVVFDGAHWAYPKTPKSIAFSNGVGPGCAKPGESGEKAFTDPRFRGRDGKPYGPLPRDWAHWKGLYLHEQHVVLSYTVGKAQILETPSMEALDGQAAFARTINVRGGEEPLGLRVCGKDARPFKCDMDKGVSWIVLGSETEKDVIVVACIADPEKAVLSASDSQVHLTIAPSKEPFAVKLLTWRGEGAQIQKTVVALKTVKPSADLSPWTKGGPPRWREKLTTKAELGKPAKNLPWVVDTLTWPAKNPWNAWMRFGGFDFFKDGTRAAACTWNGDVWIVSGIKPGDALGELTWQRIATGLFQPLGLRIVDDQIYVCGRDQITRLVDLNDDGETDFYQNFNNDHQVTEHFHEFAMGLQTDDEGNFIYAKSGQHARDSLVEHHGTLLKVSKDGVSTEILANGYRAANGVGVGPGGTFFTSDQEGFWMPANRINLVERGSFSGNMFSYHRGKVPTDYDRPIVWLPKSFDRSPAEQVWVRDERWGLPKDSIISLSYGTGQILSVIHEPVKGVEHVNAQGAAFRLGLAFPTGIMRGRFHPGDGQLYACGLFGWSSDRASPGGLWRVRHTGAKVHVPAAFRVVKDGVILGFTHPLDRKTATDVGSYLVEQWNYQWTKNYGSPEFKVSDGQKGRDTLKPKAVALSKDGRSVLLSFADFKPSMQLRIKYELDAADGSEITHDLYGSVFVVPAMEGATLLDAAK